MYGIGAPFRKSPIGYTRSLLLASPPSSTGPPPSDEELVSSDFLGNPHSAIVDLPSTALLEGSLAKVLAWYDNEWGYSCRVRDLVQHINRWM